MVHALNKKYGLYKLNINKTTYSDMLSIVDVTSDTEEPKINSL